MAISREPRSGTIDLLVSKWTVVNHALFYSTRENTESESVIINRISKKRGEIFVKLVFFFCNFLLIGGVFHKCSKSKYHSIHQNIFGTILSVKNTPFTFFAFSLLACQYLFELVHFPIWKLHSKLVMFSVKIDREIIFQSLLLYDCFSTHVTTSP